MSTKKLTGYLLVGSPFAVILTLAVYTIGWILTGVAISVCGAAIGAITLGMWLVVEGD